MKRRAVWHRLGAFGVWFGALGSAFAGSGPSVSPPAGVVRLVIDGEPSHLNPLLDPDLWGHRIAHDLVCEPLGHCASGYCTR